MNAQRVSPHQCYVCNGAVRPARFSHFHLTALVAWHAWSPKPHPLSPKNAAGVKARNTTESPWVDRIHPNFSRLFFKQAFRLDNCFPAPATQGNRPPPRNPSLPSLVTRFGTHGRVMRVLVLFRESASGNLGGRPATPYIATALPAPVKYSESLGNNRKDSSAGSGRAQTADGGSRRRRTGTPDQGVRTGKKYCLGSLSEKGLEVTTLTLALALALT